MFVIRKALAKGASPPIPLVVELGFIPIFAQLLRDIDDEDVRMEVAWSVTNIAASKSEYVTMLRHTGIHYRLVELLEKSTQKQREQVNHT